MIFIADFTQKEREDSIGLPFLYTLLYFELSKITHSKNIQVPRPKSQEPSPNLYPRLEFGFWNFGLKNSEIYPVSGIVWLNYH